MFSPEELKRILQESDVIKNVSIMKETKLFENVYQTVFQGELIINERESFVVYIAVPEKWYRDLVDIYVADYNELAYMPHIDNKGKLCLFETEGILIDQNLPGIMMQSLLRAQTILKQGFSGENKNDFINEFELYWAQLKDCRIAHLAVETDRKNRIVKGGIKKIPQKKKEKQIEYIKRCKKAPIYIGENVESLKRWNLEKTPVMNIAYFVIYSEKYIFPPDIRKKLSIDYLNALLHFVPEGELASIMPRSRQDRIVVFEIHQPSGQTHFVGMYIKGGMLKETSLEKVEELQPLLMERADKKFLMKRVTEQDSENYKNRILIIGCGSIGGHVICELAKAGYEDLTIVDYEKLTEENIFRHVLGMEYVNRYKCEALNTYIQKNIPEVKITTLAERIEDAIIEEDIVFEDYNLIISATGNHNLNRWVNSWILDNKIEVPVVYLWNEVYGIGNHVAYIKYGNCGCYECFFDRDEETGELYDKTSYCKRGQIITESAGGCGKTYVPYGNLVSLKTMLLCLKMVKDIFEEKLDDNLLISLKGDNDYLEKHNLEISGRYLRQQERIKILTGKQFVNINCGVCNDCNGK